MKRTSRDGARWDDWVAPEHMKSARWMERDYEADNRGRVLKHAGKVLKLDPRPTVLVPPRKTYPGTK